jgi:hypothetical protein
VAKVSKYDVALFKSNLSQFVEFIIVGGKKQLENCKKPNCFKHFSDADILTTEALLGPNPANFKRKENFPIGIKV